ncbi:MAG: calcium/sodium antiporter [Patescibacteria group bacterium]|nr:calcium/sodium antiporter [Patescibacteria group bacterium]
MLLNFIIVAVGFVLLVKGADLLVGGASSLAKRMGISTLLVGLTVVALGTSMPELVVNVFAALSGTTDIAVGNIIGSNISNIALVLGVSAVLFPLRVHHSTIWKEIPYALLAVVLVSIMASDMALDRMSGNVISRGDGLVLVSFTFIFLYYIFGMAKKGRTQFEAVPKMSKAKMVIYIVAGILLLVAGGKVVIEGAVGLATALGMSSRVIGLTVVALGTSLPELVTSVVAALRKQSDMAVGNIVGSNILNVFMVLGISATIMPLPFSSPALFDAGFNIVITLLLFLFLFVGKKHMIERWQGLGFVALYCLYIGYSVAQGRV